MSFFLSNSLLMQYDRCLFHGYLRARHLSHQQGMREEVLVQSAGLFQLRTIRELQSRHSAQSLLGSWAVRVR